MVAAGRLRHFVLIQKPSTTVDGYGHRQDSWTTHASVWASIDPLGGRELQVGDRWDKELTHKITMRFVSGVTPEMRVYHDNRIFNIESVFNRGERNKELEILAKEVYSDDDGDDGA